MPSVSLPVVTVAAGALGAAGGIASGAMGASAEGAAGKQAAAATNNALASQNAMWAYSTQQMLPWEQQGLMANSLLTQDLPYLATPTAMDQTSLQQTPGYQFTLDQGLKATQNAAATRGLGVSGAALKGAATYATGLADSTWKDMFNADQTNKTNIYNKLYGLSALGENAAAGVGNQSTSTGNSMANTTMAGMQAQNSANVNGTNALISGMSNATNSLGSMPMNYLTMQMMQNYMNNANTGMYGGATNAGGTTYGGLY